MSGYISVPRQAGGHLKNGVVDILVQWSGGHIGGGIAYERIVALAARSTAPPIEPPEATVAGVVDEYLTAKDAEITRLMAALKIIAHIHAGPATDYSRGVQQLANSAINGEMFVDTFPPYPAP